MFWAEARRRYGHLTAEDPDIRQYLALVRSFQEMGGQGLAGYFEDLGRRWVVANTPAGRVLEIGAGIGKHARLNGQHDGQYFVSEFQGGHLGNVLWRDFKNRGVQCDASRLPFRGEWFDGVVSTYSLEHMRRLDETLTEVVRVLRPGGRLVIALPCEGGLLYNLGREVTTRRVFQRKFGLNYDKLIAFEHVHDLTAIRRRLQGAPELKLRSSRFYPALVALKDLNVIACFSFEKRT